MAKRIVYPTVDEIIATNKRILESRKSLTPKELKRVHKKIDTITGEIRQFWKKHPTMRLGQLLLALLLLRFFCHYDSPLFLN